MHRLLVFLSLIGLVLGACQAAAAPASLLPLLASPTAFPTAAPMPSPVPSATASLLPPTSTPAPEPTPTTEPVDTAEFRVRFHPDGPLFVGDQVSLEVIAPPDVDLSDSKIEVRSGGLEGRSLGTEEFERFGIGGRTQATFRWAWDTTALDPGTYTLYFFVEPGNTHWTETVTLLPEAGVPPPEPEARWASKSTDCCVVHYVTGTEAERDLSELVEKIEEQAHHATEALGTDFEEPIPITLLPRVLGHGGFAGQEISVSYLDRNYAGSNPIIVIHHEMVHLLDSRLGGELRPTLFVEGLAVYLSGGHFKSEPLLPRAAALLPTDPGCEVETCGLGLYISLPELIDNFYFSQHEVGYLEAAALIEYMVARWGWEDFSQFYRDIQPQESGEHSAAIDAALQEHFALTLGELEEGFVAALREERLTAELREDVRLTVDFYEAVRSYQQTLDTSAYFLTAWLPDNAEMRERVIVADYLRRPSEPENLALETMLVAADTYLRSGDYERTERMLEAIKAVLNNYSMGETSPFAADPIAAAYLDLVYLAIENDLVPQRIQINGDIARIWTAVGSDAKLQTVFVVMQDGEWRLGQEAGLSVPEQAVSTGT